jgi:hypothetical protein
MGRLRLSYDFSLWGWNGGYVLVNTIRIASAPTTRRSDGCVVGDGFVLT